MSSSSTPQGIFNFVQEFYKSMECNINEMKFFLRILL